VSLLSDSFNEPKTDDTTSTPSLTVPKSVPQLLAQRKKKNPNQIKAPTNLARAIGQAQRARQSNHKYGQ
jgi:hypothetical protein